MIAADKPASIMAIGDKVTDVNNANRYEVGMELYAKPVRLRQAVLRDVPGNFALT